MFQRESVLSVYFKSLINLNWFSDLILTFHFQGVSLQIGINIEAIYTIIKDSE